MDAHLMADPPALQSTKPRNSNWGGRRKGSSGRKKSTQTTLAPTLSELPKARVDRDATRTYCPFLLFLYLIVVDNLNLNRYVANETAGKYTNTCWLLCSTTQPLAGFDFETVSECSYDIKWYRSRTRGHQRCVNSAHITDMLITLKLSCWYNLFSCGICKTSK
jgi:hypothetical protein